MKVRFCLLLFLFESIAFAGRTIESDLSSQSLELDPFTIEWVNDTSKIQLSVFHKDIPKRPIFQSLPGEHFLSVARGNASTKFSRGSFVIRDYIEDQALESQFQSIESIERRSGPHGQDEVLVIKGSLGESEKIPYSMTFSIASSKRIRFSAKLHTEDESLNRLYFKYRTSENEKIFGFGEQYTFLDLKGRTLPVFPQEQGLGRGLQPITGLMNLVTNGSGGSWDTTYTYVPHYMTSENQSLFIEGYQYLVFDMKKADRITIKTWGNQITGQLIAGSSFPELIEEYTTYSGRMKPLPDWFHRGAVIGIMGGSQSARSILDLVDQYKIPTSSFWLQDWVGTRKALLANRLWWNWNIDPLSYPDWHQLVGDFNEHDPKIEVLGYVNPFLSFDESQNQKIQDALGHGYVYRNNHSKIASELGYLIKDSYGNDKKIGNGGFDAYMVDLYNPKAREWYKSIIKQNMIDNGMKGWMADFGEALPFDTQNAAGLDSVEAHIRYVHEWVLLNEEVLSELKDEREDTDQFITFVRTGGLKSPGSARLFWAGDQLTSWDKYDGLKSSLTALISSGFSGYSINHSDIGGIIGIRIPLIAHYRRDAELLYRWTEVNAFSPVFRTHDGINKTDSVQFYSSSETLTFFERFASIYSELFDYRKVLMKEAHEKGYPMTRHMMFHYQDDLNVYDLEYQFMYGKDFLLAPVTEPGETQKTLYLPKGEWVHLWSDVPYAIEEGQWVTVEAPIGKPPVFFQADSIYGKRLKAYLKAR